MSSLDMITLLKVLKISQIKKKPEIGPRDAWNQNKPSVICNYKMHQEKESIIGIKKHCNFEMLF